MIISTQEERREREQEYKQENWMGIDEAWNRKKIGENKSQ